MPHYTCANCKVRRHVSGISAELGADLCPRCGSPLEPAAGLEGLVGFQSVEHGDEPIGTAPALPYARLAARLDELATRRTELLPRDDLGAEPWGHDDEPVAMSVALPIVRHYR